MKNKISWLYAVIFMTATIAFFPSYLLAQLSSDSTPIPAALMPRWSVFGGVGWTDYLTGTNHKTFAITNIETDQLNQTSSGDGAGYTIGFARNYDISANTYGKLQMISIGMTVRYDPLTFDGQVFQFQESALNNYTYRYQISPISELAEFNLVFHKIPKLEMAPFIITGVGITENSFDYQETSILGVSNSAGNGSGWAVTPDIAMGAGFLWNFKQQKYFLKVQYLFQYRGDTSANVSSFKQNVPVNLNEQSVDLLFGYRFK